MKKLIIVLTSGILITLSVFASEPTNSKFKKDNIYSITLNIQDSEINYGNFSDGERVGKFHGNMFEQFGPICSNIEECYRQFHDDGKRGFDSGFEETGKKKITDAYPILNNPAFDAGVEKGEMWGKNQLEDNKQGAYLCQSWINFEYRNRYKSQTEKQSFKNGVNKGIEYTGCKDKFSWEEETVSNDFHVTTDPKLLGANLAWHIKSNLSNDLYDIQQAYNSGKEEKNSFKERFLESLWNNLIN